MTQPTQAIESAIQAAGSNVAPRITPADIEANIESWWYFTAAEGANGAAAEGTPYSEQPPVGASSPLRLLTFCVLVLRNGFTVTGESACASPENFNADIGRRIARENAVAKIWPLMGYELRSKLHAIETAIPPEPTTFQDRVRAEYNELNERLSKLVAFFVTDTFEALPAEEKDSLTAQHAAMCDYSNCLRERIHAFGKGDAK